MDAYQQQLPSSKTLINIMREGVEEITVRVEAEEEAEAVEVGEEEVSGVQVDTVVTELCQAAVAEVVVEGEGVHEKETGSVSAVGHWCSHQR